jgi:hypothetical protein
VPDGRARAGNQLGDSVQRWSRDIGVTLRAGVCLRLDDGVALTVAVRMLIRGWLEPRRHRWRSGSTRSRFFCSTTTETKWAFCSRVVATGTCPTVGLPCRSAARRTSPIGRSSADLAHAVSVGTGVARSRPSTQANLRQHHCTFEMERSCSATASGRYPGEPEDELDTARK